MNFRRPIESVTRPAMSEVTSAASGATAATKDAREHSSFAGHVFVASDIASNVEPVKATVYPNDSVWRFTTHMRPTWARVDAMGGAPRRCFLSPARDLFQRRGRCWCAWLPTRGTGRGAARERGRRRRPNADEAKRAGRRLPGPVRKYTTSCRLERLRGRVAVAPRLRRGLSADGSRRRRGYHVDCPGPWGRLAAAPRLPRG